MRQYEVGDKVRFDLRFTRNGTLVDPATITLKVKDPGAITTTYTYAGGTITKTSTGLYWIEVSAASAGEWTWRAESTGDYATAQQGTYIVQPALA